jgi:hypothetical protein
MSDNVVALPGYSVPTPSGEPVAPVVEILREYLAMAESGELRAVALACVCAASEADERIVSDFAIGAGTSWALEAAIGRMRRTFESAMDK